MNLFGYIGFLLQQYVVPLVFAIGLIYLIYGIIQYFIIGPGEEPTRDAGRVHFIQAFVWFLGGLLLYGIVVFFATLGGWIADVDVTTDREERVQPVPNVPTQN